MTLYIFKYTYNFMGFVVFFNVILFYIATTKQFNLLLYSLETLIPISMDAFRALGKSQCTRGMSKYLPLT